MAALMVTPTDFEAAQLELMQRRGRYAQQQQLNMPKAGEMVGNRYVATNPLNYLAEGLRAYGAQRGEENVRKELADLQGKRREAETKDLSAFVSALRGTPAQPEFQAAGPAQQGAPVADPLGLDGGEAVSGGGYTVPAQAAKPGDPMAAYFLAAASQSPMIRQMGIQGMAQVPQMEAQKQERMDNRAFRAQEAQLARQQRMDELNRRAEDQRLSQQERLAAQAENRQMMMENQRQMQQFAVANRPERMVTVLGPNGEAVTVPQSQSQGLPLYNPQAAGNLQKEKTKAQAKDQLSGVVQQLNNSYTALEQGGGITSTAQGGLSNLGARLGSTAVGQAVGGALGTQNQRQRQEIEQTRPLLLNLIKDATGMTASQMNSNAEMQLYLKAATDPTLTVEANRSALANLDKMFGLGLAKPPADAAKPPAGAANPQDAAAMQWAQQNPNDPRSKAILQRLGGR